MANIASAAIQAAIRDVLNSAHGSLRTIAATVYDAQLYDGLNEDAQSRRALVSPIIEPSVYVTGRHKNSPPIFGNLALYSITVHVRIVRHLRTLHKLDSDKRDAVAASLGLLDADRVAQALTYPGNLTQDASANATGIVSGRLKYEGSEQPTWSLEDQSPGRIETTHNFSGVVQVAPATS